MPGRWTLVIACVSAACGPGRGAPEAPDLVRLDAAPAPVPDAAAPPVDATVALPLPPDVAPAADGVVQLELSSGRSCARLADGRVRCWGLIAQREHATPLQLDVADAIDVSLPPSYPGYVWIVTASGRVLAGDLDAPSLELREVATDGRAVEPSGSNGALLLRTDGSVVSFHGPEYDPEDAGLGFVDVVALDVDDVEQLDCALRATGAVSCSWWFHPWETMIASGAVSIDVSAGRPCARLSSGTLRCWSRTLAKTWTSEDRTDLAQRVRGVDPDGFWCERTPEGGVRCAGIDRYGQLGHAADNDGAVALPSPAVSIAIADHRTCAVLADGGVACWGLNRFGELGDGTLTDRSAPVRVVAITADELPPPADGLDAVGEAEVAMDWSGRPKGCDRAKQVFDPDETVRFAPVSAYAIGRGDAVEVWQADHRMAADGTDPIPRGRQQLLRWTLSGTARGRYVLAADEGEPSMGVFAWAGARGLYFYSEPRTLSAKITHVDADWICGTVEDRDAKGKARTQRFAARRIAAP